MEPEKPSIINYYLDIREKQYNILLNYQKLILILNRVMLKDLPEEYEEFQLQANQIIRQLEELEKTRRSLAKDLKKNRILKPESDMDEKISCILKEIQAQQKKNQLLVQEKMTTINREMGKYKKNKSVYRTNSIFNKIGKPSYIDFKQ